MGNLLFIWSGSENWITQKLVSSEEYSHLSIIIGGVWRRDYWRIVISIKKVLWVEGKKKGIKKDNSSKVSDSFVIDNGNKKKLNSLSSTGYLIWQN